MEKRAKHGGRKKGVQNKITRELKDMILGALDAVGGQEYLERRAKDSPNAFMTLVGKVLPLQVTGKDGGAIQTEDVSVLAPEAREKRLAELLAARGGK